MQYWHGCKIMLQIYAQVNKRKKIEKQIRKKGVISLLNKLNVIVSKAKRYVTDLFWRTVPRLSSIKRLCVLINENLNFINRNRTIVIPHSLYNYKNPVERVILIISFGLVIHIANPPISATLTHTLSDS